MEFTPVAKAIELPVFKTEIPEPGVHRNAFDESPSASQDPTTNPCVLRPVAAAAELPRMIPRSIGAFRPPEAQPAAGSRTACDDSNLKLPFDSSYNITGIHLRWSGLAAGWVPETWDKID